MSKLTDRHIHVIAFDIPYPPNYGGVIDVFYKVRALHEAGLKVHLHCFEYGRKLSVDLTKYCFTLKSYPRKVNKTLFFSSLPYIVVSRSSELLIKNLAKDNHPILFEGLHSCYHLNDFRLAHRKKFVRTHNIEHEYYTGLAKAERNLFKRLYFYNEATKLKNFEIQLSGANGLVAISPNDHKYFSSKFKKVIFAPAFHPFEKIESITGKGDYAFYHGNLAVAENNEAALFLVNEVFNNLKYKLIIAGNHPSKELIAACKKNTNIELIGVSDNKRIDELMKSAHVNVLPTFQATGIKLKLINSLYSGRFCLANSLMVKNTGMEDLCIVSDTAAEMKWEIEQLFHKEFTEKEIEFRKLILLKNFSNAKGAADIIDFIFLKH